MDVDQAHAGVRTPVTQQADLGVFNLQGLFQERVISQIDHSKAEVQTRSPVSIYLAQLLSRERRVLNCSSRFSECAEVGGWFDGGCHHTCILGSRLVANRRKT